MTVPPAAEGGHVSASDSLQLKRRRYTARLHSDVVDELARRVADGSLPVALAILISDVLGPGEWRNRAACRGEDVEQFFPDGAHRSTLAARSVCATCEVSDDCFAFADAAPELDGIWGGYNASTRRRDRPQRPAFTRPTTICVDCHAELDSYTVARCAPCSDRAKAFAKSAKRRTDRYSRAHVYGPKAPA